MITSAQGWLKMCLRGRGWLVAALTAVALTFAGCASLDGMTGSPAVGLFASAPVTDPQPVLLFVASTRPGPHGTGDQPVTGEAQFSLDTVTVPPRHAQGVVEHPSFGSPDPARHFVLAGRRELDSQDFLQEVAIHLSGRVGSNRDVLVFVHGFNTSLEDARFRLTQIVADSHFGGVPVLFTWPSRGSFFAYGSDRESAMASRDALERLLADLAKTPGLGRVHVLAHSMGAWIAMEALRENAIAGQPDLGGHLGNVMLAAPDIDLSVFKEQMARLGEPGHVSIFVSSGDRALLLSSQLAGDRPRLGALDPSAPHDHAELEKLGVKVYDLSAISDGLLDHTAYADTPAVIRQIGRQLTKSRPEDANTVAAPGSGSDHPLDTPQPAAPVSSTPLPAPGAGAATSTAAQ